MVPQKGLASSNFFKKISGKWQTIALAHPTLNHHWRLLAPPWHVGNTGSSTKGLFSLHQILHLMRQVCNTVSLCLCIQYCQSCQSLDFPSLVCLHMLSVGAFLISMQGKHCKQCGKDEEKVKNHSSSPKIPCLCHKIICLHHKMTETDMTDNTQYANTN